MDLKQKWQLGKMAKEKKCCVKLLQLERLQQMALK